MSPLATLRPAAAPAMTTGTGPHAGQPIAAWGAPIDDAQALIILLHGRGGTAADMLALAPLLVTPHVAALAPQARGQSWYPHRFTDPTAMNEPHLGSALSIVSNMIQTATARGLPGARVALVGFSQGACLALECAARHAGQLGAVIGFSGGLIGDEVETSLYPAHSGMAAFLGCSEHDPHIPLARVRETEAVLKDLGADVETHIHPGAGHGIRQEDLATARSLLMRLLTA
jgi:predicted esterase